MKVYKGKNANYLYKEMLKDLNKNGTVVSPRGMKTKEFYPVVTIIEEPRERLLSCYGRKINPFFLVAESLWILNGNGDREWITYFCKDLDKYSDKGFPNFNGAYGVRLRKWGQDRKGNNILYGKTQDQIKDIIKKLSRDKDTRQAVATLHNPFLDRAEIKSNDRPCNTTSYFKIRNNKLHLHQILRSNDINLGLFPTNLFQWSMIQEYIASVLCLDVGELLFFSDSLHVYCNDKITKEVLKKKKEIDIYRYYKPSKMPKLSLKESDKIVNDIIRCSGTGDIWYRDDYWYSLALMLDIYKLRKKGMRIEAIEKTKYVDLPDFKIMAYNYHYNKAKNKEEKDLIEQKIKEYPKAIKDFIMEV